MANKLGLSVVFASEGDIEMNSDDDGVLSSVFVEVIKRKGTKHCNLEGDNERETKGL